MTSAAPAATTRQYCTFLVNGALFGVDVHEVQEVIRFQPMTRVPLAPAVISGLINLRGQIVTAIDLRHRLGLPAREDGQLPVNVVVRRDGEAVSLLVDEIDDVVEIEAESVEAPPQSVAAHGKELIAGVHQLPDRLLLVLDTDEAFNYETGA